MGNLIAVIVAAILGSMVLFILYGMFFIIPLQFYAEAKCLRAGYPVAHVTIGLETYCSNQQGTVTVKVDKLK